MTENQGRDWPYPGSHWWKFDFHTHTPASSDYGKGPDQKSLRQITPRDWLLGFMRAGIDCVAVTDHNSGEWIDRLKQALIELKQESHQDFRPLNLFPGVEITANGGIHILSVLDSAKGCTHIGSLLGAVDFKGTYGASDAAADASPIKVVEAICKAGGVPVLAHVDGLSGAWQLTGNTLVPLLESDGLVAMEVVDRNHPKPAVYTQRNLRWAEVLGSDAHHPAGPPGFRFPGSNYTWVKMATPSLEGLRLALLDGNDVSIRRSDEVRADFDPFHTPMHFIESLEIKEAGYMGRGTPEQFRFNPWFNALIGGRGTGKSTAVHFLRLAFQRENDLAALGAEDPAFKTFDAFARKPKNRLDKGGLSREDTTGATVTLMRDGVRHRLIWRQGVAGRSVEQETTSGWQASSSQEVTPERFPLRLFSQGQIASLATGRSPALLDLIDQAIEATPIRDAIQEEERRFLALRANHREQAGRLANRGSISVQLEDVRRKLDRFEQAHHAQVLKAFQATTRQERELTQQFENAEGAAESIAALMKRLAPEDVPPGLFNAGESTDASALDVVSKLHNGIGKASDTVAEAAKTLRAVIAQEREDLAKSTWNTKIKAARKTYDELIAALQSQGVTDPSEYGKLVQERQRLEGETAKLDSLAKQLDKLEPQANDCLSALKTKRRELSRARQEFLANTLVDNAYVRITLEPYGRDAELIERSFRDVIGAADRFDEDILTFKNGEPAGGLVATLLKNLPKKGENGEAEIERRLETLTMTLTDVCGGQGQSTFGGHFTNYLQRKCKERPEFLDRILTWFPEDTLYVEYSQKGDGKNFRPIEQGSVGQRAAAMLAFLLAHGTEPIVLDQPEDDLDNHLIYDLVVRQIRANKQRRQIIAVTHNPNIVVNGDAEMIHALNFSGGQCRVSVGGSLQDAKMRDEICTVMEGGREAFDLRYRRIGRA